ncbi:hypothetical protein H5410_031141 [Solanum commersonii]|uniref:Uncharacterized protein n=1 Tax=Solanum commersonii TaxID=4109 RepID=A0A9J5YGB4_SOLCO|nr:hypothetical protein H5410_031141 [Solanum commersonii]
MARPKVLGKGPQPQKKEKWVVLALEVKTPQSTRAKPPQESGVGKCKKQVVSSLSLSSSSSDIMGINSTHLTTSNSENEKVAGSRTSIHTSPPDREPLKRRQSELHSKIVHDQLAQC